MAALPQHWTDWTDSWERLGFSSFSMMRQELLEDEGSGLISSDLRGCRRSESLRWAEDCDKRFSKTCSWDRLGLGTLQWMFRKKTECLVATSTELCSRAVWAAACVQGFPTLLSCHQAFCCLRAFAQTVSPSWTSPPPEASPWKPLSRKRPRCTVSATGPPTPCRSSSFRFAIIPWFHTRRLCVYCVSSVSGPFWSQLILVKRKFWSPTWRHQTLPPPRCFPFPLRFHSF